jgi:adenosylcobyric acid synthase
MLSHTIDDNVESGTGTVPGLGLLPTAVRFAREKTLGRPVGQALGQPVHGYEIHHGLVSVDWDSGGPAAEPFLDGARLGSVFGTTWHGALENDGFRRAFLAEVARLTGRRFVPAPDTDFGAVREARLDRLGDLIAEHVDTDALWRLIDAGAPDGLLDLPPGATIGGP